MADREDIVEIFSELRNFADNDIHPVVSPENWHVYSKLRDLIDHAEEAARALLKEQEARVMTLDEVKAFDWDYCYLEEVRLPGKVYRAVCGDHKLTCITWPCVTSMQIQYGDESYGKKWRCWSAKPTDEQRQAVKWE